MTDRSRSWTVLMHVKGILVLLIMVINSELPAAATNNEMERQIATLINGSGAEAVAVAFHDLQSGSELLVNADRSFHPASTMKIAVMLELFHRTDRKSFSLDDRVTTANEFKSIADGSVYSLSAEDDSETTLYTRIGEQESYRELNRLMIAVSSNLATNILVEKLGANQITEFMRELGAPGIKVVRGVEDNKAFERGMNNVITARSLMTVLRRIAEGTAISKGASREMVTVLLRQHFNDGIPAGLPKGAAVAHKTGWTGTTNHDAGLVYPPGRKPYVLVVLTRGIAEHIRANQLIAEISRAVYNNLPESDHWKD